MALYDWLIVGSGLCGATFAREMTNKGYKCLVIDSRNHIGGNCWSETKDDVIVSKYGGHIFHTHDESIWKYFNKYCDLDPYRHSLIVDYHGGLYSFPINNMSLLQLYPGKDIKEARKTLELEKAFYKNIEPANMEEWCLKNVGQKLFEVFIEGYTTKQWGQSPKELPADIIKRIPIRDNFDTNYYPTDDMWQGFPNRGYDEYFKRILKGIEVLGYCDYFSDLDTFKNIATNTFFTGKIDKFYDYKFGNLEYRSLRYENFTVEGSFQGCVTVNYTDMTKEYTRIIEHKYFQPNKVDQLNISHVSREYPDSYTEEKIPFYPVNTAKNNAIYNKYKELADQEKNVIFCGRLAEYKYYDMDDAIKASLTKAKEIR